jgi:ABC-type oligopeptide transport system substrate-binding subunit
MANYIKIKAADVNVANQLSDILIGHVDSVYQGLANGDGDANKFTVYADGKSYLFTVTAKGKEWADQFISAVTANPGGIMSIVQNDSGVKVTDIVIA